MGFSRQEYWSGLPFSPPGDLPHPGIERMSTVLTGVFFTTSTIWEAPKSTILQLKSKTQLKKIRMCHFLPIGLNFFSYW